MVEVILYSLLALVGSLIVAGAIFAVGRVIGAAGALEGVSELRTRITELEIAFAGFAEQYEISNTRSAAKIGKLRRKIERLEDGEEDHPEEEPQHQPHAPAAAAPTFATGADVLKFAKQRGVI